MANYRLQNQKYLGNFKKDYNNIQKVPISNSF